MAKLVVVTHGLAGLAHEVTGSWDSIGCTDENKFKIVDSSISGQHCEVRLRGNELVARDLCSANGTFAHGQKITEAVLTAGQMLRVGDVELRFEAVAAVVPAALPFVNTMLLKAGPGLPAGAVVLGPHAEMAPAKKQHVLFVDDSIAFRETFGELCSVLSDHAWEIHFASSADQSLVVLQQSPIDLVVLDLGLPLVDGIQLLDLIRQRYPGVKLAVLTGMATEGNRATALANGADLFIEKPVSAPDTRIAFNLLNELVSQAHREGFSGTLRQVGLQEVIQLECNGRRSVILEIRNRKLRGRIYIEVGAITHAEVADLVGDQALNRLLSQTGGEFQLKPFKVPPQRSVQERWELLLMEAARCSDEDTAFIVNAAAEAARQPTLPDSAPQNKEPETAKADDDFVVVATYDGHWNPAPTAGK